MRKIDGMNLASLKRILVPTDFTDPSNEALETAIELARGSGATLDLVHVAVEAAYPLPPPIDVATLPLDMDRVLDRSDQGLAAEEKRVRAAGLNCETTTLVGRADTEIVNRARDTHADLIVMGTHGRSGLAHALFGSNVDRVVQHTPCPVLIVPKRP
ncbi:MAG TPA: universal stress protein [Polyangia bacterium]|nr:universal stress protein [Polyangia bacterium]